ncbi:MAG: hypothetical protein WKF32_01960 [Thermoleophilaceae bacterium]
MQAALGAPRADRGRFLAVPVLGSLALLAVVVFGRVAPAIGVELGPDAAPFVLGWEPEVSALVLVALAALVAGVAIAPRLLSVPPGAFALIALGLGLLLRVCVAIARGGVEDLYAVYDVALEDNAANEYLPVLPALEFGARRFLDTFAEIGTALPVHAVGHPPGLLLTVNALSVDTPQAMAALTIGAGALCVPLTYVAGRELLGESRARVATLLYAFAPSAILYGATSADALFAALALVAATALVARHRLARSIGPVALALAAFFSYANLAIGAFAAVVVMRRQGLRSAAVLSMACAVALLAMYGLLHLFTGYDPIGAVRSAESVYREGVASTRPYAYWAFGSPAAFLLAAGLPIVWLALRALGEGATVAVAMFAVVGVAAALGFSKAETERIYQFLVPLLCLAAAAAGASELAPRRLQLVLAALGVQAIVVQLLFFTVW